MRKNQDNDYFDSILNGKDNKGYKKTEMGAPPFEHAKEGRANSLGITRLYVADSENTCIHEIRAGAFDIVSIGTFKLKKEISVIDFKQINSFSPFSSDNFNYLEYLINKPILKKIDNEMSKNEVKTTPSKLKSKKFKNK